ncbi:hypothetical protein OG245_15360 [Streptomyces sp. NBC_01116]|uniref:hypothetical protein n=1 Tax=Streptomyces sp. NBC_01116 TaxID=2903752 RepID=UPI003251A532
MADTFGGPHRRPDHTGIGHTQRELCDRAYYDQAPRAGVGCAIALPISGLMWWGLYEAGHALIGAIA